jgi:glycopeptide antibiotics resistance protein
VEHTAAALTHAGVPPQVTQLGRVEFLLNALMVVPVPLLGTLLWRRWSWQHWTSFGFIASCGVELFQALFLPDRSAQNADVVSNTLGAFAGSVLGTMVASCLDRFCARPTDDRN